MQRRRFVSLACQTAIVGPIAAHGRTASIGPRGHDPRAHRPSHPRTGNVPLTGTLVGFGQAVQKGAGAAFAEINARNWYLWPPNSPSHLVDDGYDPERSVANIKNILQGALNPGLALVRGHAQQHGHHPAD